MFGDRLFVALEQHEPEVGWLLVAAPDQDDPAYNRSVLLILNHSEMGTVAVDLAHRSDVPVAHVMPQCLDLVSKPQVLYIGGKTSLQSVVGVAVTELGVDAEAAAHFQKVTNRIAVVDMTQDLERLESEITGMRLFAGFHEWHPGGLDQEVAAGDWYVAPALPSDVLAPASVDVWGDVMRRQPMPLPLFATFPSSTTLN